MAKYELTDVQVRQILACAFATETVVHLQGHRLDPRTARGYLQAAQVVRDAFPRTKEPTEQGGIPTGTWVRNASGQEGCVQFPWAGGHMVRMEEGTYDADQWPEGLCVFTGELEVVK